MAGDYAACAGHQVSVSLRHCIPGSAAPDAPQPHQGLWHDWPQGPLPTSGLCLYAQQLLDSQPAGAAMSAIPTTEGAGIWGKAGIHATYLLPLLLVQSHPWLPSRDEERAPEKPDRVPDGGPPQHQRMAAALSQAPVTVQPAVGAPAQVLGADSQEDAEVFARNHSVLQAYQPGSTEKGQRQQSGCRNLRLGLQESVAAGSGLPAALDTATPVGAGLCHRFPMP